MGVEREPETQEDRLVFKTRDPTCLRTGEATKALWEAMGPNQGLSKKHLNSSELQDNTEAPGPGRRELPAASLPRVLPVTPPGKEERLVGPARSPTAMKTGS